jgi:formylmethanofuran dehydrogenase subunit E-like metal-binding protein
LWDSSTHGKSANDITNFRKQYEKALIEHKKRARSEVEEETEGCVLEENVEDIFEDAVEEHHQDVVNASDNLANKRKG